MGGTERQVVELAVDLRRRDIPVTVLSRWPLHGGNPYVAELEEAAIDVLAPGWTGRRGGRLRRLPYVQARLRAGTSESAAVEAQLWRWQAARVRSMRSPGFVLHEMPFFGVLSVAGRRTLTDLRLPLVHTILGRMEGVVPVVDVATAVVTTDGDPVVDPAGTPVRWIPSMGPRALADHGPDLDRPQTRVVTFGGRLVREKGVDVLLRAATKLPGIELVIAGYGPERANLEALAGELGVVASFTGPLGQRSLHGLLARTDVAVFPGLQGEGLPSFVVEALGAGVPVVGTDVGAVGRALGQNGGTLVRPGDAGGLAAAVAALLEGDLRARRHEARRLFERCFAPASVVDAYLGCYADALHRACTDQPILEEEMHRNRDTTTEQHRRL
ncbi:MAG: glycosyltransferase family 4 protein [Actinobacteria bacterium]|nr:glycosyltransferase family 4 protein [Actinomycetota bacterium]MBW3614204.1 glycosyltransferase family 4 protein [Actinomycetota bacterium]